jgi:hypothetical protein
MRIELNEKATSKALAASGLLDKSPNLIVNIIIENLEAIEITQVVTMKFKNEESKPSKVIVKKSTWLHKY